MYVQPEPAPVPDPEVGEEVGVAVGLTVALVVVQSELVGAGAALEVVVGMTTLVVEVLVGTVLVEAGGAGVTAVEVVQSQSPS